MGNTNRKPLAKTSDDEIQMLVPIDLPEEGLIPASRLAEKAINDTYEDCQQRLAKLNRMLAKFLQRKKLVAHGSYSSYPDEMYPMIKQLVEDKHTYWLARELHKAGYAGYITFYPDSKELQTFEVRWITESIRCPDIKIHVPARAQTITFGFEIRNPHVYNIAREPAMVEFDRQRLANKTSHRDAQSNRSTEQTNRS